MATDRVAAFRTASEVLAGDASRLAQKLRAAINEGHYGRAEMIAAELQRAARDTKWLMNRQPKD